MRSPEPGELDTGTLALFVGFAAAGSVRDSLTATGFGDLRFSHGYVFQHLIDAQPTVGDLSAKLGMTQQGASKAVLELEGLGYVERVPDPRDARIRRVRLTERGHAAVDAARRARASLEERLRDRCGDRRLQAARDVLVELLDELGGTAAVRRREIRPPG